MSAILWQGRLKSNTQTNICHRVDRRCSWFPPACRTGSRKCRNRSATSSSKCSNLSLKTLEACLGVAEPVEGDSHPVHDAEIQAAHLAVLVSGGEIVERPPGLERSAKP